MAIYDIGGNVSYAYDIDGNIISDAENRSVGYVTKPEYKTIDGSKYRLVWRDEFEEKDLDRNFWSDYYMISNVENRYQAKSDYYLGNDLLHIRVKKDMPSRYPDNPSNDVAQSSIQTGETNFNITLRDQYHDINPFWGLITQEGYYEMRLKPWSASSGCCNVWWAVELHDAKWQKTGSDVHGEIDFIEYQHKLPNYFPHGQHKNADPDLTDIYRNTDVGVNLQNAFHTIGCLWEGNSYKWYFDGVLVDTFSNINIIQHPVFHIISAYKVKSGETWLGPADSGIQNKDLEFLIDYFRVYKKATSVSTEDVTISSYTPIVIDANNADMEIDPDRGCPYEFPSYVYVNWSDGSRTEHWVKWDAIRDTYQAKISNQTSFEWSGYVYGLGVNVVASVNYS